MDRWAGKVAIVTGASSGIGLETVKALIQHGMTNDIKPIEGKGKFYALNCDVSKEQDVNQIFEWVKENLGGVHILVKNAGVVILRKIIDTNKDMWDKDVGVNIMGLL
ncbi:farnesol dehydrogenase-like [Belonocnema kinseyi]|uniref:farnesol dehydrogenase-like n=1 Tax=Belonocnema kinseyi TaxID=2817044 RepID=UPI00143DAF15|nr:farnesol dehydrogenase-like [Belonocnema kinseyi]